MGVSPTIPPAGSPLRRAGGIGLARSAGWASANALGVVYLLDSLGEAASLEHAAFTGRQLNRCRGGGHSLLLVDLVERRPMPCRGAGVASLCLDALGHAAASASAGDGDAKLKRAIRR